MIVRGHYNCIVEVGEMREDIADLPSGVLAELMELVEAEIRRRTSVERLRAAAAFAELPPTMIYLYQGRRRARHVVRRLEEKMPKALLTGLNIFVQLDGQVVVAPVFAETITPAERAGASLFMYHGERLDVSIEDLVRRRDDFAAVFLGDGGPAYLASEF